MGKGIATIDPGVIKPGINFARSSHLLILIAFRLDEVPSWKESYMESPLSLSTGSNISPALLSIRQAQILLSE